MNDLSGSFARSYAVISRLFEQKRVNLLIKSLDRLKSSFLTDRAPKKAEIVTSIMSEQRTEGSDREPFRIFRYT